LCRNRSEQRQIQGGKNTPKFGTLMVDQEKPGTKFSEVFFMIEVEKNYASKGVGGTALGLSIGAIALEGLRGGLNGLIGGCGNGCGENMVSRYEATQAARIAELETEVKLRDANVYTMTEMGKLRDYVDNKFNAVNAQLCQQAVVNAQVTANLACLTNTVNTLSGLTKTVIPITSVCPEPMPAKNSWTAPTAPTTGA
jgi:hypothetical protein